MASFGILELLALRGFDLKSRFKLVRHQDRRYGVQSLVREGWLETYQSFQSRPVFDGCDFILSFTGVEGSRARLHGVYKVGQRTSSMAAPFPKHCPYPEWQTAAFHYELTRVRDYDEFCGRVIVEWGKGTLAWVQNGREKSVYEITPKGHSLPPFADYLDFSLTFRELQLLRSDPDANPDWRARLSAVAGVYLIVATTTGQQYVGAASGAEGIWGRWSNYALNGHAENVYLRKLVESNSSYPEAFAYSLLQIVPRSYSRHEVLRLEKRYKDKLGKRATDLNGN